MDNILRCSGYLPTMTLIHNTFIENYMLSANGSYVKVYLYLARCIQTGETDLSISALADKMDNTEKDVLRALHYWEKHNLIQLSKDESGITGIEMLNPEVPVTVHTGKTQKNTDTSETVQIGKKTENKTTVRPDGAEAACTDENTYTETTGQKTTNENAKTGIAKNIPINQNGNPPDDEEFVWTCRVIESYVSRPLNSSEVQLISYLYNNLKFSSDLLLYLYEYCISRSKTSVSYIQAVAVSWHEKNIKTPEEAKNFSSNYNSVYTSVSKALGLGRPLPTAHKELVSLWLNEWNMDLAVILDACNRTVLSIPEGNFNYVKRIVEGWHDKDAHTLQDIQKIDEEHKKNKANAQNKKNLEGIQKNTRSKNQFDQFMQREVSQEELDELEKKLLAH